MAGPRTRVGLSLLAARALQERPRLPNDRGDGQVAVVGQTVTNTKNWLKEEPRAAQTGEIRRRPVGANTLTPHAWKVTRSGERGTGIHNDDARQCPAGPKVSIRLPTSFIVRICRRPLVV